MIYRAGKLTLLCFLIPTMVSALLGQTAAGGSQQEVRQCLASALPFLQQHALLNAESKLVDCQRQFPESAILSNALGIVYEQQGRSQDAVHAFEKALTLLPSFTAAQIHLGTLYSNAGKNCDRAKLLLRDAVASTSDAGALVASGIALARCHDTAASVQALSKALQSNPSSVPAAYNLALAHFENNDLDASLLVLKSLSEEQQAADPDILFLKGKVVQGLRKVSKGGNPAKDYEVAALLSNSCRLSLQEDYCAQAALELIHQERFGDAADLLEKSIRSTSLSVHMQSLLGLARFRLGRYREAISAYEKAIDFDPSAAAPREGLGFLLYMTGDLDRAKSFVEAGLHGSPTEFYLLYLRALILYRESSTLRKEALESVSAAIIQNPRFAPAYFLRGKIHSDQNAPALALTDFLSAVKIDPDYALPYYRMARIYSALGRPVDSEEAARQFSLHGNAREDEILSAQATARLTTEPN